MYEIIVIDINGEKHRHVADDFDTDENFLYILMDGRDYRINYNFANIISWSHRDIDEDTPNLFKEKELTL